MQRAHQLIGKQKNSLQAKLAVAEVEEVFQTRPKEIEHHRVVVAFCAKPPNERHTNATSQSLVDFRFVLELRVLCFD